MSSVQCYSKPPACGLGLERSAKPEPFCLFASFLWTQQLWIVCLGSWMWKVTDVLPDSNKPCLNKQFNLHKCFVRKICLNTAKDQIHPPAPFGSKWPLGLNMRSLWTKDHRWVPIEFPLSYFVFMPVLCLSTQQKSKSPKKHNISIITL